MSLQLSGLSTALSASVFFPSPQTLSLSSSERLDGMSLGAQLTVRFCLGLWLGKMEEKLAWWLGSKALVSPKYQYLSLGGCAFL